MNKYYCTNGSTDYKKEVEEIINRNQEFIFKFFNEDILETNFNVYIYDSIDELVKAMKKRGFKEMPSYMCACFKDEDNSINLFEPKLITSKTEWTKSEYETVIIHELIHAIQFLLYGKTPEWINEGIAKYLDGTYKSGIKNLLDNYINKSKIPKMEEIINEFGMHEYNSYGYAYLIVSYLIDTLGKDNFLKLVKNNEVYNKFGDELLVSSINYYNNLYGKVKSI